MGIFVLLLKLFGILILIFYLSYLIGKFLKLDKYLKGDKGDNIYQKENDNNNEFYILNQLQ